MDNPRWVNETIRWGSPEKPEKLQDAAGLVRAFTGKFPIVSGNPGAENARHAGGPTARRLSACARGEVLLFSARNSEESVPPNCR
jgi:hypothetical protein